jgi:hypothetical protein
MDRVGMKTYAVVFQACVVIESVIRILSGPKIMMMGRVRLTLKLSSCKKGRSEESIRDNVVPFLCRYKQEAFSTGTRDG